MPVSNTDSENECIAGDETISESESELKKRYKLRGCHVDLVSIANSETGTESESDPEPEPVSEPEMYSKPGPLSTKRFIHVRKLQTSPAPPPSVVSRESRESISIDVVDEFVVDESSASSASSPEIPDPVANPKIADVKDETDNDDDDDDSAPEDAEVTVTKSGRKVMKPKMQNFITLPTKKLNKTVDSETETEEEDRVLSKEKIEELMKTLPETFLPGDLAWARLGVAPYWPCTITLDPDQEIHSNVSMKGKKAHREYHVQVSFHFLLNNFLFKARRCYIVAFLVINALLIRLRNILTAFHSRQCLFLP